MLYLFFLLVSISPPPAAAVSTGVTTSMPAESTAPDASPRRVVSAEAFERGSDVIFQDGFESGGFGGWNADPNIIFSATTAVPEVDYSSCDLPEGTYTFRVAVDGTFGGASYEYIMTVTERRCGVNQCKDVSLSDPVIVFN